MLLDLPEMGVGIGSEIWVKMFIKMYTMYITTLKKNDFQR